MDAAHVLLYALIGVAGVAVVAAVVRLVWHAAGVFLIRRAGPRRLFASHHVLWREPGLVEQLDMVNGPGGADGTPAPPFHFLEEHLSGSQPCVSVRDARGRRWRVKWGDEVRSENFAVRLVWACGYFAETTYFVREGEIEGAKDLRRAASCIGEDCRFSEARFELDDPDVRKMFEEHSWAWNDNPFVGTAELNGLKVLTMLLSNWDAKDRRDVARGSNTAIFEYRVSRWRREARYLITDWGGSMGRWGNNIVTRGRWDPDGFEAQSAQFVTGTKDDWVQFGYTGQRTDDIAWGISVDDVRWLCRYLARITDGQFGDALMASGADQQDAARFTRAIRERISQLVRAANNAGATSASAARGPHR